MDKIFNYLTEYNLLKVIAIIALVVLVFVNIPRSPNVVTIPETVLETGKIENHELAGSYRIDCLKGREILTLYDSFFSQAEFVYTGSCINK